MRVNLLAFVFSLAICMSCSAQFVAIPDSNFAQELTLRGYGSCIGGNSTSGYLLDTTCPALLAATSIYWGYGLIHDFTGLRYFKNVKTIVLGAYPYMKEIPEWPDSVRAIQLDRNPQLSHVADLPVSDTSFVFTYDSMSTLPLLPPGIQHLIMANNKVPFAMPATLPPALRWMEVYGDSITSIPSLPPNLEFLNCSGNKITALPALPASLQTMYCNNNLITSLPSLPTGLKVLLAYSNQLTGMPAINDSLQRLILYYNNITSLPVLNNVLLEFNCGYNQLTSLPALPPSITTLAIGSNPLPALPAAWPPQLVSLYCNRISGITSLPALPSTLTNMDCSEMSLTSLPALPAGLHTLTCYRNSITSLPALPAGLTQLICSFNPISVLPSLPATLSVLTCGATLITELPPLPPPIDYLDIDQLPNLHCLPRIYSNRLQQFYSYSSGISCLPNRFTAFSWDRDPSTMPLCDAASGCDFYYNVAGDVHQNTASCAIDSITHGVPLRNMKVQLKKNGNVVQQFYTFSSGGYTFLTDSLSTYQVSIDTTALTPLYTACPGNGMRTVALSHTDSVHKNESFGIGCLGTDFGVNGIFAGRFRPAFQTTVNVLAGDASLSRHGLTCAGAQAGTVTTSWTGPASYIAPASSALVPTSIAAHTLTYVLSDLSVINNHSLDIILATDSAAGMGDLVCITTTITPSVADVNPADNTLLQCFGVVNSYDPNLKEVYPDLTAHSRQWLTYTVHFQNTGNDTAYTVVLKDTLSPYLDASSFQYIASSSHAVVQLFDHDMAFTFPHINLPDSLQNPAASEGWIQYKVRTNSNLPSGVQIKNTAAIYFDLNPPVMTNTTVNRVAITCTNVATSIARTICNGDSVMIGSHIYRTPGTSIDTIALSTGCDSVVTLQLTVRPVAHDTISRSICMGDSFVFGNTAYHQGGYYTRRLSGANGCDSIVSLHLSVQALVYDTIARSICSGDSIRFGGSTYRSAGYYSLRLTSMTGCDSFSTLHLTVHTGVDSTIYHSICYGDSFAFAGRYYHNAGFYTHIYNNVNGCDSLVILNLTVWAVGRDTISQNICSGDSFVFGGNAYRSSGYYTRTLAGANGCDSLNILHLSVRPVAHDTASLGICHGDSIIFGGSYYRNSGYYSRLLTGARGCDSFVVLHLSVRTIAHDTIAQSICNGDSVRVGGSFYHTAGIYSQRISSGGGCDSFVVLNLSVHALPAVIWPISSALDSVICVASDVAVPPYVVLTGGSPAGGSYSGYQVSHDTIYFSQMLDTNVVVYYSFTSVDGCTASVSRHFHLALCLGIDEENASGNLILYPNPNMGTFTLRTTLLAGEEYEVYDMLGQIIQRHVISGDVQNVDLGSVAPGVYSLMVKGKSGSVRFTVMK